MKILIVGSTSTIARAIAERVRRIGHVKFAGRRDADYLLDLAHLDQIPAISERFDLVIHAAADFSGASDQDLVRCELVNSAGTLAVCALARQVGAKRLLLISSSSAAYRPGDSHYGIYALSKRHGEEAAQLFCSERDIALTILRPTQVYDSAGGCRQHQNLLYFMADRAQAGEDICLHGSRDALRNYLYLDDLAEVCFRVVEQDCQGLYTCGYPQSVRLSEVARAAFDAFGQGGRVRFLPEHPDLADLPPLGPQVLYDQIDYCPRVNINDGLKHIKQRRELSV